MGRTVLPSASAAGALIEWLADGKTVRPTISQQPFRTCVKQISHKQVFPEPFHRHAPHSGQPLDSRLVRRSALRLCEDKSAGFFYCREVAFSHFDAGLLPKIDKLI